MKGVRKCGDPKELFLTDDKIKIEKKYHSPVIVERVNYGYNPNQLVFNVYLLLFLCKMLNIKHCCDALDIMQPFTNQECIQ